MKGRKYMKYAPIISKFPHFLHGGDYNPDQWLKHPKAIDEDFRLMDLSGCNTFSLGIFAWTSYEPEEGKFNFDWLDKIMDRLAKKGYNAILATPSGARPAWMAMKYPEVRRVKRDGQREPYHDRHNHCWTSPVYREKVNIINTKLAERYKNHPALGAWHISNEYNGECMCDLCLKSWYGWLEKKYKTLDNLNERWWTYFWSHNYTAWNQIDPHDGCVDALKLDWSRFITWQCCDFMKHEIAPLKKLTPNAPVTTNMMGFFNGLDYWRVAEVCDVIADDAYPSWYKPDDNSGMGSYLSMVHDMHRSFKGGKPFMLMESCPSATNWQQYTRLKRPGVHKREMLQTIAHGADGTMYFQYRKGMGSCEKFHGAVVDHVGHENTRVFKEVAEIGKIHRKLDDVIGTSTAAEVALVFDWDSRWALDFSQGPTNANKKYVETCQSFYRPFWNSGVSIDVIESISSFDKYKVLVLPMLFMIKKGVAEKLTKFVSNGGTVIASYLTGIVDENDRCFTGGWPGCGLRKLFGIWNEEIDGITPDDKQQVVAIKGNSLGIKGKFKAYDYCEQIHLEGAKALAVYGKDFYAGKPAVTVNKFGKGKVYYVAARTSDDFLKDLSTAVISEMKVKRILSEDLPSGVTAQMRTDGKREFVFVFNFRSKKQKIDLGKDKFKDMLTGKTVEGRLKLEADGSAVLERL
ncbi:MAG TPA: beta-galactosidase [Lentisphaeria bacterium]|nr:beta-galactosidase [Lentisphaeria bacterium]